MGLRFAVILAVLLAVGVAPEACWARPSYSSILRAQQQAQQQQAKLMEQAFKARQAAIQRAREERAAKLRAIGAGRANVKESPHSFVNVKDADATPERTTGKPADSKSAKPTDAKSAKSVDSKSAKPEATEKKPASSK
jgi:hypothetical protein